jgi:polar amino acid transport system substrate-binding protein
MSHRVHDRRTALMGLALGVIAPAWAQTAQTSEPTLTLATGSRAPLVSSPGQPGFVEEVARAALRRAGYALRVVPLPVERALVNANAGIEDGDLYRAAGFEKDYPNLVQVPQPLVEQDFVAFAKRADVTVRGLPDLSRYSVAYVTGNKILERQLQGIAQLTSVRDNAALFELLAADRVDVVVINRWVGYLAAHQSALAVRMQEPPLLRVPMFMYLHHRHAGLVPRLAAALAEVRRDGTWQRLYDRIIRPLEQAG